MSIVFFNEKDCILKDEGGTREKIFPLACIGGAGIFDGIYPTEVFDVVLASFPGLH